jgi:hypothetical protein
MGLYEALQLFSADLCFVICVSFMRILVVLPHRKKCAEQLRSDRLSDVAIFWNLS